MDPISYSKSAQQEQRIKKFVAEPDSASGLVTVPSVIASGETVSIPTGRTLVHPNLQVDGTLEIDGTLFIPSGGTYTADEVDVTVVKQNGSVVAIDSAVVHNTGNETIAGVKTFTLSPIVPTPTSGDNSTKIATTAFVKSKSEADSIGVGQTWQNVAGNRVSGTTYTNSTGKPIQILVTSYSTVSGNTGIVIFNIDGIVFYTNHVSGASTANNESVATSLIIPNGATYSVTSSSGSTISGWLELR